MSEEMVSCIYAVGIYIPLLNEGTDVIRPTKGAPVGERLFQVLPTPDYSPDLEEWEFPPGSIVQCALEKRESREVLVARSRIS